MSLVWLCKIQIWLKCKYLFHVKTENISNDIAEDNEIRFDTSNFELARPLPKGKNGIN